MPPKKKTKPKKTKNQTISTPWEDLDLPTLEQEISNLTNKRNKALQERIQIQTEHDAVRSYYNVTRQQIDSLDDEIKLQDYQVDKKKEDDVEEKNIYQEKIQQLNYDFQGKVHLAEECKRGDVMMEKETYEKNIQHGEENISAAREELRERQVVYVEEIRQQKVRLEDDLCHVQKSLEKDLEELEKKCVLHEAKIEDELDLKRQVALRVMEEQQNFHIFELERRHEELCNNTHIQYSNTSSENASKISKLEEECEKASEEIKKSEHHSKTLQEENDRLSGPLKELTTKVNLIKTKIKDKDKNRQSLLNVRSRKIVAQDRLQKQKDTNAKLQKEYNQMKNECDTSIKELDAIDRDAESIEQSRLNIESITSSISEAITHSKDFQDASGVSMNSIKGSDKKRITQFEHVAMDAQRSFNKALWRLRGEVKSISLQRLCSSGVAIK